MKKFFRIGDKVKLDYGYNKQVYLVCYPECEKVVLMNISTGNRLFNPVPVELDDSNWGGISMITLKEQLMSPVVISEINNDDFKEMILEKCKLY